MKRVFIIHGWGFNPGMNWYPWAKQKLEERGYQVVVPEMPDTLEPTIEKWVGHLAKIVGEVTLDTYFVGHSMGCQTIMRFLENTHGPCGGAVFVAPWFNLDSEVLKNEGNEIVELAKPWLETPINLEKVRNNIPRLDVFLSSNEPYGFVSENKGILEEKLGAHVTVLENKGHFTEDDGVTEISEIFSVFN